MTTTPEEIEKYRRLPPYLKQVAVLLASGCSVTEMVSLTGLSEVTVRAYRNRLYDATGIRTGLKLAVFIVRHPQIEKMLRESL